MLDQFTQLWRFAPLVILLLLALWIWHKIMIDKLEMIIGKIERERDDWKRLALDVMKKSGIKMSPNFLPGTTSFKKKEPHDS